MTAIAATAAADPKAAMAGATIAVRSVTTARMA